MQELQQVPETSSNIVCHKSVAYEAVLPKPVRNNQTFFVIVIVLILITVHIYMDIFLLAASTKGFWKYF